jgi:hypothetical protein
MMSLFFVFRKTTAPSIPSVRRMRFVLRGAHWPTHWAWLDLSANWRNQKNEKNVPLTSRTSHVIRRGTFRAGYVRRRRGSIFAIAVTGVVLGASGGSSRRQIVVVGRRFRLLAHALSVAGEEQTSSRHGTFGHGRNGGEERIVAAQIERQRLLAITGRSLAAVLDLQACGVRIGQTKSFSWGQRSEGSGAERRQHTGSMRMRVGPVVTAKERILLVQVMQQRQVVVSGRCCLGRPRSAAPQTRKSRRRSRRRCSRR